MPEPWTVGCISVFINLERTVGGAGGRRTWGREIRGNQVPLYDIQVVAFKMGWMLALGMPGQNREA